MKLKEILIYLLIVFVLVFVDQMTKYYVFKIYGVGTSTVCIPKIINFNLLYNKGAMFGILQGKQVLFTIVTIIGLAIFIYALKDSDLKTKPFYTIGLLFTIAGAIGNFIDRLFLGQVRDFIDFAFFQFASFNVADMCMCVGVVMIMIDLLFSKGELWK